MKCVKCLGVRDIKHNVTHAFFNRVDQLTLIFYHHDIIVFHQPIVQWFLFYGDLSNVHIVQQFLVTVSVFKKLFLAALALTLDNSS